MSSHGYAVQIEHIMSDVFGCGRSQVGGIVNADNIEKNPLFSMFMTLVYIYATADEERRTAIASFIEEHSFYRAASIDHFLVSDNGNIIINGSEYSHGYSNGEEAIEAIIKKFEELCELNVKASSEDV